MEVVEASMEAVEAGSASMGVVEASVGGSAQLKHTLLPWKLPPLGWKLQILP